MVVYSVNAICFLLSIILGFYKTGSNTESFIPWQQNQKLIKQYIESIMHYMINWKSLFFLFVHFKFCFLVLFCLFLFFFFFLYEGICNDKKFCHSNTIVLNTQLTFIEKGNKKPLDIYHCFNFATAQEQKRSQILFILEEISWKNVGNIYFSSKIRMFSLTFINILKY